MSLWDNVKKFAQPYADDDYDDYDEDEEYLDDYEEPAAPARRSSRRNAPAPAPAAQDDRELIAVITAAIAAYQSASGQPNLPFRVVSFTRKNNASGWMGNSADNQ